MRVRLKQKSQEWLDFKKNKIGSSEIFGLIKYYITEEELINIGINKDFFQDLPYSTAYELFHKLKNPSLYISEPLKKEYVLYGDKIEEFAYEYLTSEYNPYNSKISHGGIFTKDNLIASLDFEGEANSNKIIEDVNNNYISLKDNPKYLIEIKAMSQSLVKSSKLLTMGCDWKFIFQTQFAMMLSGYKFCKIFIVSLINDNQFERGYICGLNKKQAYKYIMQNAEFYSFIYKERPEYQYLIKLALDRFNFDLRANNTPKLPNNINNTLIYRLADQRGNLLGTRKQQIESVKFDLYFDLLEKQKNITNKMNKIKKDICELMLNSGKTKLKANSGEFSLNEKYLKAQIIKKGPRD
jgi:hypothetical protein